jgi:hypothetical protein
MQLKAGARLASATSEVQVVVVKATAGDVDVRCGDAPMVPLSEVPESTPPVDDEGEGVLLGKRYTNADGTIELLCTKAGAGSLAVSGEQLVRKDAKPLPSSD